MFENWTGADFFISGVAMGYIWYPIWYTVKLICTNAWYASNPNCNNNCRQGRDCDCKDKT